VALERTFRLRKKNDFQRVRQQGRSVSSRLLILAWAPNQEDRLRIGFVVSKRISKLAVERNYLKRLFSEAIRPSLAILPTGWDLVIHARSQSKNMDLETLRRDILYLLRRAQFLPAGEHGNTQKVIRQ
jgi:ribonuclease P protein component